MDRKALQDEFNVLVKEVQEFQTRYSGDQTAPRDELNAMLTKAERMDAIKADLEGIQQRKAFDERVATYYEYARTPAGHAPLAVQTGENPDACGEEKDGWLGVETKAGFTPLFRKEYVDKNPGIRAMFDPAYKRVFDRYLRGEEKLFDAETHRIFIQGKALADSSNVGGGFAVPIDFVPEVIQRLPGMAVFTDKARHITTNRDQIMAPRVAANTGSYPTMYSSAVVATWVSENPGATTGQVAPVFESVAIPVATAKLETILSKNLIQDAAFNVGSYLTEEFRTAYNLFKDASFLIGTGLAQPQGVTTDPDISASFTLTSKQTATVVPDDVKELKYKTAVQYQQGAMYFLSLDCLRILREQKDGNGNYIWSPGFNHGVDGSVPDTLEGSPYAVSDFLQTAGTSGNKPIFYGNPRHYWVVDRLDMSIQVLSELYAESNQLAYLAFARCGGHVVLPQAFRVLSLA